MRCKVCTQAANFHLKAIVLDKYNVSYYRCPNCGFIQTEDPYWLSEAYSEALNIYDTGAALRTTIMSRAAAILLKACRFNNNATRHLDFAGGYGLFVRTMRDLGFDFFWQDQYAKNLMARGFEYKGESNQRIGLITAFEVFEHFVDPIREVQNILAISPNVLFSTRLVPEPTPLVADDWEYFAPHHGQHTAFWTKDSLELIAKNNNLHFYSNGESLHLITAKKLPMALVKLALNLKFSFVVGGLAEFFWRRQGKAISDQSVLLQRNREMHAQKCNTIHG